MDETPTPEEWAAAEEKLLRELSPQRKRTARLYAITEAGREALRRTAPVLALATPPQEVA